MSAFKRNASAIRVYDRFAATAYAEKWALSRNPKYYDFTGIGGDCTNFISQCLYAGGAVMNYTPDYGWYYRNSSNRAPAWSGVDFFYRFITNNKRIGPFGHLVDFSGLQVGDVIQFGNPGKNYHHTLLVMAINGAGYENILVATHSFDALNVPLTNYDFTMLRFIHISGIRIL